MYAIDITGQRFNRWTVLSRAGSIPQGEALWLCRCGCGTERVIRGSALRDGYSKSCGCLKVEVTRARSTKHGHSPAAKMSPTYSTWAAMVKRCTNPAAEHYADYGGRGIYVCERWHEFANFLADMGEKPLGTSLDRHPNNDGPYEPSNCRWATSYEQGSHKRNTHLLAVNGETHHMNEWARILGVSQSSLSWRVQSGWSDADAILTPFGEKRPRR